MTTKKREYEKPSLEVVKLQQQSQLLAGSAGLEDYNWQDEEEE